MGDAVEAPAHRNNCGRSSRHFRHIRDTNCTRKSRSAPHPASQRAHRNSGIWFSSQVPFNSLLGNIDLYFRVASLLRLFVRRVSNQCRLGTPKCNLREPFRSTSSWLLPLTTKGQPNAVFCAFACVSEGHKHKRFRWLPARC